MATTKITISLDADVAREARQVAGPRGLSRLVNETVRHYLQAIRPREADAESSAKHASVVEDAERRSAAFDQPR